MTNLIEFLRNNFWHVAPILILGGVALAISIERFRALVVIYPLQGASAFYEKIRDFVLSDRLPEAIALCDRYEDKPVANVIREALLQAHQPETLIQQSIEIASSEATQKVQKRTSFLATIANVATLMGLFGTILGLVQSFEAIGGASAQQRSALLASGISTAMNATMLGLGVAIPCMVIFAFLANRTNLLNAEIEQAATRALQLIQMRYYSNDQHDGPKDLKRAV